MKKRICAGFATLAALSCLAPVETAAAHASEVTMAGPRLAEEGIQSGIVRKLTDRDRIRRSKMLKSMAWEGGSLTLLGEHVRTDGKDRDVLDYSQERHRSVSASMSAWQEILPGMAVSAGGRVARTKSSFAGGPLMSTKTAAVSQEVYVMLRAAGQAGIRLSAFDNGGWSNGNLADAANRMLNGEEQARKGMAAEIGLLGSMARQAAFDEPRLALRLERSRLSDDRGDNSAALSLKVQF